MIYTTTSINIKNSTPVKSPGIILLQGGSIAITLLTGLFLLLGEVVAQSISQSQEVNASDEKVGQSVSPMENYVTVSATDPNYFQLTDGSPYIPVGLNVVHTGTNPDRQQEGLAQMEEWMRELSANGGNFMRIWLSNGFWEVEDTGAGQFNEDKARRIDRLLELARQYNIRLKMTLEHFRGLTLEETSGWAAKLVYHTSRGGPLDSVDEYMTTEAGHQLFLDRMDFFADRYGSDPVFFGWELWNEINAMTNPEDSVFYPWHHKMLEELKNRFPQNLVMQSLGSFDREHWRKAYQMLSAMEGNEIAQVHRYLDLGAEMEISHQPMDIVASSAIRELLSYNNKKPILLAETGGVEPKHTGPIRYYELDKEGILLHDALFAPFFSGSAGGGQNWHWNNYVAEHDLWYQYGRFSEAIKDVNPIEEQFLPIHWETDRLRVYALKGLQTLLLWVRDKENTWRSEFEEGIPPQMVESASIDINGLAAGRAIQQIRFYDPWKNQWSEEQHQQLKVDLPAFSRSLVMKITVSN